MIHTPRTPPPPKLLRHSARWTIRFQTMLNAGQGGDWATTQAKKLLRAALRDMAFGKCAYREGALDVTAHLEIEHYVAKTVDPNLAFEWGNLLPACSKCNTAKGECDHRGVLLKPDAEDPEPYFWLHPDTGKLEPHPGLSDAEARRAGETIRICDLQRPALCTKRIEMMQAVLRWLASPDAAQWNELSDPRREYKFVLRHVLEQHGGAQLAALDRATYTATRQPS